MDDLPVEILWMILDLIPTRYAWGSLPRSAFHSEAKEVVESLTDRIVTSSPDSFSPRRLSKIRRIYLPHLSRVNQKFHEVLITPTFWAKRAYREFGFPLEYFPCPAYSPPERYFQLEATIVCYPGAERYCSLGDCLRRAAQAGDSDLVDYFLSQHPNPHTTRIYDEIIYETAKAGFEDLTFRLLSEAGGSTLDLAISGAARGGKSDLFELLLKYVLDSYNMKNPLYSAAAGNQRAIISAIIEKCSDDTPDSPFYIDSLEVAIHGAAASGSVSLIRLLTRHLPSTQNVDANKCVLIAIENERVDATDYFIDQGANCWGQMLYKAGQSGNVPMISRVMGRISEFGCLISFGALYQGVAESGDLGLLEQLEEFVDINGEWDLFLEFEDPSRPLIISDRDGTPYLGDQPYIVSPVAMYNLGLFYSIALGDYPILRYFVSRGARFYPRMMIAVFESGRIDLIRIIRALWNEFPDSRVNGLCAGSEEIRRSAIGSVEFIRECYALYSGS